MRSKKGSTLSWSPINKRFPIILDLKIPLPVYRWRLVASTYDSARAVLEGALVLIVVLTICAVRTHLMAFAILAAAAIALTLGRLWDRKQFMRARAARGDDMDGTPDSWMRRHALGAMASAALWGGQDICVLLLTDDAQLQCLVLMFQAGWIAGACVRMAACPAAVIGQVMVSLVPTVLALFLVPDGLIKVVIPTGILHIIATLRISRSLGLLLVQNIESQQLAETANMKLIEANAKLTRRASIDGLTGIANRRAFDEALEVEWSRACRESTELSLLMLDVDFFKLYNDRYGHQAGDECLRLVALYLSSSVERPADLAARYGGEEFVALLPATGDQGARNVAEKVRTALEAANMPHEAAPLGRVSASIGVASVNPTLHDDRRSLIRLADAALYEAKRSGRNRVHSADTKSLESTLTITGNPC